ncbi:MAG TPA: chemotaxis protein CheW [Candidatus Angelobacter sp.]|nr:chemotaxis protein CheW [Candidatus Angelobacter sp.]
MTAVFVPGSAAPSPFVRADVPDGEPGPARRPAATGSRAAEPPDEARPAAPDVSAVEGYVVFRVGATDFAVRILEVREIVRAARLELLPSATTPVGHGVALVDARGRSIPVVDLRADRQAEGDVLLPLWRHQVGLVVDRVVSVQSPHELTLEQEDAPEALPSYARGVLRPVDGGAPVLLITLPDATELALDAQRTTEPRLGDDVLGTRPTPPDPAPAR